MTDNNLEEKGFIKLVFDRYGKLLYAENGDRERSKFQEQPLPDGVSVKIDIQGMYKVYDRWPEIAKEVYNSDLELVDFKDIDHVVFSGMGGSGTIGDLFSSILSKSNVHTTVVKGYVLPKTVDENTLVVATSVSGNTAETLSTLESASKKSCSNAASNFLS